MSISSRIYIWSLIIPIILSYFYLNNDSEDIKDSDIWTGIVSLLISVFGLILYITTWFSRSIFSWFIASQQIPQRISEFMLGFSDSKFWFLVNVNILLILIGMFMESISAILILVPVLMPVAIAFGVDPLHFGLIIILNLSIGMITPPYGITLFVASSIAERSIVDVSKKLLLPLSLMFLVLILATYFPQISLYLPGTILGYK